MLSAAAASGNRRRVDGSGSDGVRQTVQAADTAGIRAFSCTKKDKGARRYYERFDFARINRSFSPLRADEGLLQIAGG